MTDVCPRCNANIPEDSRRCPACGEELDVFLTIPPPKFAPTRPKDPVAPAAPPEVDEPPHRPEPAPAERPPKAPVAKRRPKPPPPPTVAARPAAPAPQPHPPSPPPYGPPAGHYAEPPTPIPAGGADPGAPPGKLRRWLIEQLGGRPSGAPAPEAPPPAPPYPYPYPPAPGPAQPGQHWGMPPSAPAPPAAPPYAPQPGPYDAGFAPPAMPPSPYGSGEMLVPNPAAGAYGQDDDPRTVGFGADLGKLRLPDSLLTLQIKDRSGQWHAWTTVGAGGVKVGRTEKNARFPELSSMATRHMRIRLDGSKVIVEDLGSLNGIFLRLARPVELEDGMRFRVGAQIIEFHKAEVPPPSEPLTSEDGETFWSRDLDAIAYLDFIRADGKAGLRYPITKPDVTILGRESRPNKPVDLALHNDESASGRHAQIRRDGERFLLEDLGSSNGTFVQIRDTTEIQPGEELLLGRVLLRAVDPMRMPR